MSDGFFGKIDRLKDTYRVHDSSKKQKKERKAGDEREFLDMLTESERNLDEFEQEKPQKERKPEVPGKGLLNKLSTIAPPPMIENIGDADVETEGGSGVKTS
jgi:hypothetical protein